VWDLAAICDQLHVASGLNRVLKIPAYGTLLIARIWHVRKGFVGIHATRIEYVGNGDPPYQKDKERGTRTLGACKGGAVWFGTVTPDAWTVVGEGTETVLSAMQLWNCTAGAATCGTAGLESLVLPSAARRVLIAADNNVPEPPHKVGIGLRSARRARRTWLDVDPTIEVEIKLAPSPLPGEHQRDWNNVLMESDHG